jgi:HlyD family secretion protein
LRIETDVREEVIRVLNAALRWRPAGAAADGTNSSRVYVLSPAGTPQAVSVRLGATDGNATEIASGPLVDGFSVHEVIIGGGPRQSDASRNRAGF